MLVPATVPDAAAPPPRRSRAANVVAWLIMLGGLLFFARWYVEGQKPVHVPIAQVAKARANILVLEGRVTHMDERNQALNALQYKGPLTAFYLADESGQTPIHLPAALTLPEEGARVRVTGRLVRQVENNAIRFVAEKVEPR